MQGRNQGTGFVQHNGIACGADHAVRMLLKSFADLLLRVTLHTTLCTVPHIALHAGPRRVALHAAAPVRRHALGNRDKLRRDAAMDIAPHREVKGQANNQKDHCRHADQGHQNPRLNMPAFFHGVSSNRKPNPHTAAILTPQPSSLCRSLLTVSSVARVSTAVSKPQTAFNRSSRDTA